MFRIWLSKEQGLPRCKQSLWNFIFNLLLMLLYFLQTNSVWCVTNQEVWEEYPGCTTQAACSFSHVPWSCNSVSIIQELLSTGTRERIVQWLSELLHETVVQLHEHYNLESIHPNQSTHSAMIIGRSLLPTFSKKFTCSVENFYFQFADLPIRDWMLCCIRIFLLALPGPKYHIFLWARMLRFCFSKHGPSVIKNFKICKW